MFSSFKNSLKTIDFYQAVPSEVSQGTISGACISMTSIITLVVLTIMSIINFSSAKIDSDLIIDQKHLAQKLKVHIDIQFPRYPCSFLSLDIQNVLKVHIVNVQHSLHKYSLPQGNIYSDQHMSDDQMLDRIIKDIQQKKGCRMKGYFQIDRVPGNFHFSCHAYGHIVHQLVHRGYKMFDMSHIIHQLSFGEDKSEQIGTNSLAAFNSQKQIEQVFLGITYTYFLDIIEKNTISQNSVQGKQTYIYTARLNEVIMPALPRVHFSYETNPMTVLQVYSYQQWHTLFIDIVGILGGIFTVSAIIDHLIHSSIHFLVQKNRLGKLK